MKQDVVQRFLHTLSSLEEIPPDVVCDINRDCANTFIKCLLEKQKWPEVLLLLTGKVSGEPPLGDGLIKDCSFSSLDLCTITPLLRTWDQRRTQLLGCLVDRGGEQAEVVSAGGFTLREFRPPSVMESFARFWRHL